MLTPSAGKEEGSHLSVATLPVLFFVYQNTPWLRKGGPQESSSHPRMRSGYHCKPPLATTAGLQEGVSEPGNAWVRTVSWEC